MLTPINKSVTDGENGHAEHHQEKVTFNIARERDFKIQGIDGKRNKSQEKTPARAVERRHAFQSQLDEKPGRTPDKGKDKKNDKRACFMQHN